MPGRDYSIFGGSDPAYFLMPKTVLYMSVNCPTCVLLDCTQNGDNIAMEQLLKTLTDIGMPDHEVQRIREYYRNDEPGLMEYVIYFKALMDDRHEYLD